MRSESDVPLPARVSYIWNSELSIGHILGKLEGPSGVKIWNIDTILQ